MVCTSTHRIEYAHQRWLADPDAASEIQVVVRGWLDSLALDPDAVTNLAAAVGEAVMNVCEHAYPAEHQGCVELVMWTDTRAVHIEVIDHGNSRPPTNNTPGHGIRVMGRLEESTLIRFGAHGTRVLLRHPLRHRLRRATSLPQPLTNATPRYAM
jgi:anti-sigma regulatory factor (Ser/Thr protein kinase)